MPRVHFVKKARKDNPAVKKGEPYYWWKFRYGGKRFSATPPRQSELTQSEFLSQLWDLQETAIEEGQCGDIADQIEEIAAQVGELAAECADRRENMPENLHSSPVAELLERRAEACEQLAQDLDSLADDVREMDDAAEAHEVATSTYEGLDWDIE